MNSLLNYMEFNLLYKRYSHIKEASDVEFNKLSGHYILKYNGPNIGLIDMYVHKVDVLDNGEWVITPLTLSGIYEKYPQLQDIIDINEELSDDYIRLIFHKLTKSKFLKYLSDMELIDYENFINKKSQEFNESNEELVRSLCKS